MMIRLSILAYYRMISASQSHGLHTRIVFFIIILVAYINVLFYYNYNVLVLSKTCAVTPICAVDFLSCLLFKPRYGLVLVKRCTVVESDRSCVVQVTTSPVHISSRQLHWTKTTNSADDDETDANCGSVHQPWTLRAPTGQHIRVHLIDFTDSTHSVTSQPTDDDDDDDEGASCRGLQYGYVRDETSAARRRQALICADQRRDKLILESTSNVLHVVFNPATTTNSTNANFLIRFYGK